MSLRDWLGNKLAGLVLGKGWEEQVLPPEPALVDRVEPADEDAPLLGPEASAMLAGSLGSYTEPKPAAPLEGSGAERLARLRLR